jgi:guanylate kinase
VIIVISGPGGVGKGTVVDRLLDRHPDMVLSRSWTTRPPRPGESPDAYRFVDRETFEEHVATGGFLEWVEFLDYLQGSPVPDLDPETDTVFEIDVQGAATVLAIHPDALSIFIDAPSREEQRRRLEGRGDDPDHIERRIAHATSERQAALELGSVLVVNRDLDEAVAEIEEIIAGHRIQIESPG